MPTFKSLYIEIVNQCNLNCVDCFNLSHDHIVREEIPPEKLDNMIDAFYRRGVKRIDLSGGELILHSAFDEILDVTKKYPDIEFNFASNGTIYHDKLYNLINHHPNYFIQFSLDGADEEVNALTRGPGNFDKVIQNIKKINGKNRPWLKMVLSQNNIHQLDAFFSFAKELGCNVSFSYIFRSGRAVENWNRLCLSNKEKEKVLQQLLALEKKYGIECFIPTPTYSCPFEKEDAEISALIKSNGDIHPCQSLYDQQFCIGSAYQLDFDLIEDLFQKLREKVILRKQLDFGCSRCIAASKCTKGCIAMAFSNNNKINADDGSCDFRKFHLIRTIKAQEADNI